MLSHPLPLQKARGATSSGSSSSAHGKSPNFRSHNRARVSPGRRQKANQQGGIPAAAREAARKPQKQVARKRTGKGIEIGRFEQPQQRMSYASDQPSQYESSQAQGATARKQDHATTASPTNQSGPGVPKDASYADTDAHLESSFGDVGIEMDSTRKSLKPPYDGSGDDNKHRRKSNIVSDYVFLNAWLSWFRHIYLDAYLFILYAHLFLSLLLRSLVN